MSDFLAIMTAPMVMSFVLIGIHAYFGLHVVSRGVIFVDIACLSFSSYRVGAENLYTVSSPVARTRYLTRSTPGFKSGECSHRRPAPARRRPRYYMQNFHYQTDGWMSEGSAELYDFQVEVLFNKKINVRIVDMQCHRIQNSASTVDIN